MSNPFEEQATDLNRKREAWDRLTDARQWIVAHYEPDELKVQTSHFSGSGLMGNKDAMLCLANFLMTLRPTKAEMVAWIDSALEDLMK